MTLLEFGQVYDGDIDPALLERIDHCLQARGTALLFEPLAHSPQRCSAIHRDMPLFGDWQPQPINRH